MLPALVWRDNYLPRGGDECEPEGPHGLPTVCACHGIQYRGFASWFKLCDTCSVTHVTLDEDVLRLGTGKEEALSSSLSFSVLPS